MSLRPLQVASSLLLASLFLAPVASAKATRFDFRDAMFRNTLYAISDATLEKTLAVSNFLRGWVEVDLQNIASHFKAEFEVDMRSFQIGPESKQVRWQESVLAVAEHPGALFRAGKVVELTHNTLAAGKSVGGKVIGTLIFQGVEHPCTAIVRVTYHPQSTQTKQRLSGNLLKVSADMRIKLSDWKVAVPSSLRALVADSFQVVLDAAGTDRLPVVNP